MNSLRIEKSVRSYILDGNYQNIAILSRFRGYFRDMKAFTTAKHRSVIRIYYFKQLNSYFKQVKDGSISKLFTF